jgi:hypothetical protein
MAVDQVGPKGTKMTTRAREACKQAEWRLVHVQVNDFKVGRPLFLLSLSQYKQKHGVPARSHALGQRNNLPLRSAHPQ